MVTVFIFFFLFDLLRKLVFFVKFTLRLYQKVKMKELS